MGWLHRKIGLGCDNLRAATIVTTDSEVLLASETKNSDLLWGLKGSGWSFGVLTAMEFEGQPRRQGCQPPSGSASVIHSRNGALAEIQATFCHAKYLTSQ